MLTLILSGYSVGTKGTVVQSNKTDTTTSYFITTSELKSDSIPDSVFRMTNLKHLSIQGMDCDYVTIGDLGTSKDVTKCRMLNEIPAKIKNLKKLESLRLNVNNISKIPPELKELKNLTALDLTDNPALTNVDYVTALLNLEHLSLFGCGLTKLPADIGKLKKLKTLGLTGNNINAVELNRIKKALPGCKVIFEK
ncbi:MAG: leucine-rich repeat domain-containing protein [Bacteroidia bacterium]